MDCLLRLRTDISKADRKQIYNLLCKEEKVEYKKGKAKITKCFYKSVMSELTIKKYVRNFKLRLKNRKEIQNYENVKAQETILEMGELEKLDLHEKINDLKGSFRYKMRKIKIGQDFE